MNYAQAGQSLSINASRAIEAGCAPQQPTLVADAAARIQARAAHMHSLIERLQRVNDRVQGSQPTAADNSQKGIEPHCEAARLSMSIDFLDVAIARFESQVERIERI